MKKRIIIAIILLTLFLISFKKLPLKTNQENFDYYVRTSNFNDSSNLSQRNRKWSEISGDTLIYTTYFKGAVCDIPNEQNMKIRISNNTLYFDFGLSNVASDCERRFGVAGIMIDFVLNKKKYPNYKELNIEYITR
jgi:hypothetical protein